ncbi:MAG: PDDEXK nuclease domain-containing protein [Bacteroidota bacterium]
MSRKIESYQLLINEIDQLLLGGKEEAIKAINRALLDTYWLLGRNIVEFEQKGSSKATYGDSLLEKLSNDLTQKYGRGFSRSNLIYMRKLFLAFPERNSISNKLSWSHYLELLKLDDELERSFYLRQSEIENWSVRELKRQMKSSLFQRLALSKDKPGVLSIAKDGLEIQHPEDIIKDPYVFEFLGLPEQEKYLEGDLEERLIKNLQIFLLELGKGFAFIKQQYRISIANRHFYVDLVFYHRILKCFVLIELKRGEITHQDIGQMNLYLNYFRKEENTEGDNEPIGIVLGAYKDDILMEYATEHIANQLFVSKYQLHLPDKKELRRALVKLLDSEN